MATSSTITHPPVPKPRSLLKKGGHAIRKRLFHFKETSPSHVDCFGEEAYTTESKTFGKIILWRTTGNLDHSAMKIRDTVAKLIYEERAFWQSRRPKNDASPLQEPAYLIQCYLIGVSTSHASPYVTIISLVEWFSNCLKEIILKSRILVAYPGWGCFRLPVEPQLITPTPYQITSPINTGGVDTSQFEIYIPGNNLPAYISGTGIEIWKYGLYAGRATVGGMVTVGEEDLALTVAHAFYPYQDSNLAAFEIDDSELDLLEGHEVDNSIEVADSGEEYWLDTKMRRGSNASKASLSLQSPLESLPEPRSLIEGKTLLGHLRFLSDIPNSAVKEPGPLDWALIKIIAPTISKQNKPKPALSAIANDIIIRGPFTSTKGDLASNAIFGIPICARPQPVAVTNIGSVQNGDSGSWALSPKTQDPLGMLIGSCPPLNESYLLQMNDILLDIQQQTGLLARIASFDHPMSPHMSNLVQYNKSPSEKLAEDEPKYSVINQSFTEDEKRFLLAEMLKVSQIDVDRLIGFIQNSNIKPEWYMMQIPNGRNMHQCIRAWETMKAVQSQQLLPPPSTQFATKKLKSKADLDDQMATRPLAWSASAGSLLQPIGTVPPSNLALSPNDFGGSASMPSPTTTVPKKRGRPSRADMEARTRQRVSLVTEYAPLAPVPHVTATSAGRPRKRGRRSAAEKRLQPANILPKPVVPEDVEIRSHEVASPTSPVTDPKQPSGPSPTTSLGLTGDSRNQELLKLSHILTQVD